MAPSDRRPPEEYEVGYGKPPKATRFKKGKSGNPSGRPRRRPTVADVLDKVANRKIRARDGGNVRQITQMEAVLLKQFEKAIKGDQKAADLITRLVQSLPQDLAQSTGVEADGTELRPEEQTAILQEILELHGVSGCQIESADDDDGA